MFDPKTFSFDVEKMTEFFKQNDFTKHLAQMRMPGVDPEAMMSAQKKNMDALVEANKAAAAGYQDLFKRQMAIFEETMAEAQQQLKAFDATKIDPEQRQGPGRARQGRLREGARQHAGAGRGRAEGQRRGLRDRLGPHQGEPRASCATWRPRPAAEPGAKPLALGRGGRVRSGAAAGSPGHGHDRLRRLPQGRHPRRPRHPRRAVPRGAQAGAEALDRLRPGDRRAPLLGADHRRTTPPRTSSAGWCSRSSTSRRARSARSAPRC